jgi:hypothetical protein
MKYNRQLMQAILWDRIKIAEIVGVQVITLCLHASFGIALMAPVAAHAADAWRYGVVEAKGDAGLIFMPSPLRRQIRPRHRDGRVHQQHDAGEGPDLRRHRRLHHLARGGAGGDVAQRRAEIRRLQLAGRDLHPLRRVGHQEHGRPEGPEHRRLRPRLDARPVRPRGADARAASMPAT